MTPLAVDKTMAFILDQQAQIYAMQMKSEEHFARHDRDIAQIDATLRRAVRLAVQEARAERKRRREADEYLNRRTDQIASAHLHPGGNGPQQ